MKFCSYPHESDNLSMLSVRWVADHIRYQEEESWYVLSGVLSFLIAGETSGRVSGRLPAASNVRNGARLTRLPLLTGGQGTDRRLRFWNNSGGTFTH